MTTRLELAFTEASKLPLKEQDVTGRLGAC